MGIYHKMSPKHLQRSCAAFAGRHNDPNADMLEQFQRIFTRMVGKQLPDEQLIADNGLSLGARS